MSVLDDFVVDLLKATSTDVRRTTRTVQVVSISGATAVVRMSGVTLDPIPFDLNLNLAVGSMVRVNIENNVARIVAKQT